MFCPTDLSQKIKDSYTPKPEVVQLTTVFNYKEHLERYISSISGHSQPLCFKFQLNSGRCVLEYRETTGSVEENP